jgi:hypothetical protein
LGYFRDEKSKTICLGWPQTSILLSSASQVNRIIDMSHRHLAGFVAVVVKYRGNIPKRENQSCILKRSFTHQTKRPGQHIFT